MKAVDKITKREHAICPFLGGFQVCLVPDLDWEYVDISYIHAFSKEDFYERFEIKTKDQNNLRSV